MARIAASSSNAILLSRAERKLLLAGVIVGITYLTALVLDWRTLQLVTKAVPVLLLFAWVAQLESQDSRWIGIGLGLSALGDLCLQISASLFLAGLSAFLCAHLAYVVAFLGRTRRYAMRAAWPVALFGIAAFLWLQPHLGGLTLPVLAYVVVICLMMWRAWAQVGEAGLEKRTAWLAALGATSFAISDTLVAYNRFVEPLLGLQILLMLLYWGGQWGIAASVLRRAT